jgi:mycofactocin precursor
MADDRSTNLDTTQLEGGAPAEPALVEEELVDEISIDGMCGVY